MWMMPSNVTVGSCLTGEFGLAQVHHRDTEDTEATQRKRNRIKSRQAWIY